jgi:hypothetical protein
MGKKPRFFRTTISVPADLKRRMDTLKESVNWSALACRAFEDKLAEIATKAEQDGLDAIIQRLRATKPDLIYQQGQQDGRRWASEQAECDDLLRLERLHDRKRAGGEWEKFFDRDYGHRLTWEEIKEFFSAVKAGQELRMPPSYPDVDAYVGERLMMAVCPRLSTGDSGIGDIHFDFDCWRSICQRFWKSFVGDDDFKDDHPSYVRGFAEGALALWGEVKDKL